MDDGDIAKQRMDRAQSRSVFIATPVARHPTRQYSAALLQTIGLLQALKIPCHVQSVVGMSNLPRARNELAAAFLASDFDDFLSIDDDMGWKPIDVVRLVGSEHPVIGGVGCKKVVRADNAPDKWCFRPHSSGLIIQDEAGAVEVAALGTGFLKISRTAFETLKTAHPEWRRRTRSQLTPEQEVHYHRFFWFDSEGEEEVGEDFVFCREWRALGGRIFIDPSIRLVHVGEAEFTGDFGAMLRPAAPDLALVKAA